MINSLNDVKHDISLDQEALLVAAKTLEKCYSNCKNIFVSLSEKSGVTGYDFVEYEIIGQFDMKDENGITVTDIKKVNAIYDSICEDWECNISEIVFRNHIKKDELYK